MPVVDDVVLAISSRQTLPQSATRSVGSISKHLLVLYSGITVVIATSPQLRVKQQMQPRCRAVFICKFFGFFMAYRPYAVRGSSTTVARKWGFTALL